MVTTHIHKTGPIFTDTVVETMEMLKLLATATVLLALATQCVDSATTAISHSKGQVLVKVGCSTNWWTGTGLLATTGIAVPHHRHSSSVASN